MRKISIIFLSILYLIFSIGLVLHNHFCNGRLAATNLLTEKHCCEDANSEKSCCKDTVFVVKVSDPYDGFAQHVETFQPQFYFIGYATSLNGLHTLFASDNSYKRNNRSLPCKDKQPTYLINRVFII